MMMMIALNLGCLYPTSSSHVEMTAGGSECNTSTGSWQVVCLSFVFSADEGDMAHIACAGEGCVFVACRL